MVRFAGRRLLCGRRGGRVARIGCLRRSFRPLGLGGRTRCHERGRSGRGWRRWHAGRPSDKHANAKHRSKTGGHLDDGRRDKRPAVGTVLGKPVETPAVVVVPSARVVVPSSRAVIPSARAGIVGRHAPPRRHLQLEAAVGGPGVRVSQPRGGHGYRDPRHAHPAALQFETVEGELSAPARIGRRTRRKLLALTRSDDPMRLIAGPRQHGFATDHHAAIRHQQQVIGGRGRCRQRQATRNDENRASSGEDAHAVPRTRQQAPCAADSSRPRPWQLCGGRASIP